MTGTPGRNPDSADSTAPGRTAPRFGRFSYDVAAGRLIWSEPTYDLFGLAPSQVVPTLALMSRHQHPDDRADWDRAITRSLREGTAFCRWHRVVDVRQRVHSVLTVGEAVGTGPGAVTGLSGFMVDLTTTLRRDREVETARAVLESAATRDLIEQAKGMVMVIFDLTESQAFDLLRWHSSYNNIKVRAVAATLVERLVDPALAGLQPRQRIAAILTGLRTGGALPVASPNDVTEQPAALATDTTPSPSSNTRISVADLPRTMMRAVGGAAQSVSIADWRLPDQPLVYVNEAFATLTGYPESEIVGKNCRFLQGPDTDPRIVAAMRQHLNAGSEVRTVLRNYRKDGTAFWNELHLSAVRDDAGRITHYIGYQSDVSERVERERQLHRLAFRDTGTGLPNEPAALLDLQKRLDDRDGDGFTVYYLPRASRGDDLAGVVDLLRERLFPRASVAILHDAALLVTVAGPATPADTIALSDFATALFGDEAPAYGVATPRPDDSDPSALVESARADAG